jgi:hypothetical protein
LGEALLEYGDFGVGVGGGQEGLQLALRCVGLESEDLLLPVEGVLEAAEGGFAGAEVQAMDSGYIFFYVEVPGLVGL